MIIHNLQQNKELSPMELGKLPMGTGIKPPHADTWQCGTCTFHNLPLLSKCQMCDADRQSESVSCVEVTQMDCLWCTSPMRIDEYCCTTCGKTVDELPETKPVSPVIQAERKGVELAIVEDKEELSGETETSKTEATVSKVVINPETEIRPKPNIESKQIEKEMEEFMGGFDLFGDLEVVEEKKPSKPMEKPRKVPAPRLEEEESGLESLFDPAPHRVEKKPEVDDGFGISSLYQEKPSSTPAKKKPKAEDSEIYLICDKCSYRNDIDNVLCYTCGYHLLDRIEPEVMKPSSPITLPPGVCKMCSYENHPEAKQCEVCTYSLSHQKMLLACPHCTMENHVTSTHCVMCEKELPETGYNKKLFEQCTICLGILDISLFETHVKECKENQKLLQQLKDEEESLSLQEKCPYCRVPFFRLQFEDHIKKCPMHEEFYQQITTVGGLTTVQTSCVKFMHENSHKQHFSAKLPFRRRLEKLGYKLEDMEQLYEYMHQRVPLIVHIHISKHMEFFIKDTHYRNQFETGKSSGSTNLVSRKGWETRMFMNRYDQSPHFERVKYGTVNFTNDPRGVNACRSYGNSYLVLKKQVRDRCTLTDQDSSNACSLIGTFKFCYHILNKLTDAELKATIRAAKGEQVCSSVVGTYKEIQIHGPIDFEKDIERMYVNEVEYGTPQLKSMVEQFSKKFGVPFDLFK